jgi:glutamyl-Q tRNA(Asp) synthetase
MATATTAIAEASSASYVGRFAPSPTGALHLGSLVAAAASYLDARAARGRWLVRIEDLDAPRVIRGSDATLLRTLDAFGFEYDRDVLYQSTRLAAYQDALQRLGRLGLLYRCGCTRRELSSEDGGEGRYPGTCRDRPRREGPHALRFRVEVDTAWHDRIQGPQAAPAAMLGDVIVRRRDGLVAYQLAVVVDDAWQGITQVVRGADLLASTGWQVAIARALGAEVPTYAHVPLVVEPDGAKLSKSRRAVPLDPADASPWLATALSLLGVDLPRDLAGAPPADLWPWAISQWDPARLAGRARVVAPAVLGVQPRLY